MSDKHERAFYDSHRESILKGKQPGAGGGGNDKDNENDDPDGLNLFQYFSPSCYSDYSDTAPDGFYVVYGSIFEKLDALEMQASKEASSKDADGNPVEEHTPAPSFGTSQSTPKEVKAFYSYWINFISRRSFAFKEKWNLGDAQNRQVRRAMEKENKDARQSGRREYNENIRNLIRFVKKRDKRVIQYEQQEKKEEQQRAVSRRKRG